MYFEDILLGFVKINSRIYCSFLEVMHWISYILNKCQINVFEYWIATYVNILQTLHSTAFNNSAMSFPHWIYISQRCCNIHNCISTISKILIRRLCAVWSWIRSELEFNVRFFSFVYWRLVSRRINWRWHASD